MSLAITEKCNHACGYCYAGKTGQDISVEMVQEALDKNLFKDQEPLILAGGEPFFEPALLYEIADLLEANGISSIRVRTNGSLLTRESLRPLQALSMDVTIGVSLDGGSRAIHEAYRQDFNGAVRGINLALQEGFNTLVTCVLTPANYDKIEELRLFCKGLGVHKLKIRRGYMEGVTDEMATEALKVIKKNEDYMIALNGLNCVIPSGGCGGKWYLKVDGDILFCPIIKTPLANIKDISSVEDLKMHPFAKTAESFNASGCIGLQYNKRKGLANAS